MTVPLVSIVLKTFLNYLQRFNMTSLVRMQKTLEQIAETPQANDKLASGDLVAVYGTLKQGFHNNRLLSSSTYLGTERSVPEFLMISLGGFPGLISGTERITIEVFRLDSAQSGLSLDYLEGYPSFYNRRQILTTHGLAWVYYLDKDDGRYSNKDTVEGGVW